MFQVFKTDQTYLTIKHDGKVRHIKTQVSYAYDQEDSTPDFDYGSKQENDKEMARFTSGELSNLVLKVTASALGETGSAYLGQVFVRSRDAESQLIDTAIELDMKNNACIELRANILTQFKALNDALNGEAS